MSLNAATVAKYLEINGLPNEGYLLKDSGSGDEIVQWDIGIDQPTAQDLSDAQDAIDADVLAQETAMQEIRKRNDYQAESDPIFFKWQRGEATEAEWLAKVAEIDARYV